MKPTVTDTRLVRIAPSVAARATEIGCACPPDLQMLDRQIRRRITA